MVVLKIDIDIKVPEEWIDDWIGSRIAILNWYFDSDEVVQDIVVKPSSKRGYHAWIHLDAGDMPPGEANKLQWLCGDDETRVAINQRRIERGVPWKEANVLFSRVLKRKEYKNEQCENCGLRRAIESLFGECLR
ncbi:MAG: hypothetical protein DRJ47_06105 [Thermoprotei archaeon]|nr:MAG: hypothetical protein DRJ47_06105 [Thermoprotei archaeon]